MNDNAPKYDGIVVEVGGTKYTVPPITLGLYFKLEDQIKVLTNGLQEGGDQFAYLKAGSAVIVAAVKRNYPDINEQDFLDSVRLEDVPGLVQAVMNTSGFAPKEGADQGPLAPPPASDSPEASSSDGSSPTPGGHPAPSSTS